MRAYAHVHVHVFVDAGTNVDIIQIHCIIIVEVKTLQQQNMLNVYHIHTSAFREFNWNYEPHFYGHNFKPTVRFARTNASLKY